MDYNNSSTQSYSSGAEDQMDSTNHNNSNFGNNNNSSNNQNRNINSNQNNTSSSSSATMSKAELRKSNKPIMEKRRRARINHCLNELKSLILEAMKKDPARHTKLEKADILEMTVKHLQSIQRQQFNLAIQSDPAVIHKFKTGFTECAEEVSRFLGQLEGIEPGTRQRLMQHLNSCATRIEQIGTFSNFSSSYRQALTNSGLNHSIFGTTFNNAAAAAAAASSIFNPAGTHHQDVNNNGRINMNGVQLIPSRLPSGELALIMPNSTTLPSSLLMPNISTQSIEFQSAAATFPRLSAFTKPTSTTATAVPSISPNPSSISNLNLNGNNLLHNNQHFLNQHHDSIKLNNSNHLSTQSAAPTTLVTTSPPLSPVSSISSLGDDSTMHTSTASDYGTKTPPLEQSITSDYFSTPPSSESVRFISRTGHLQQPHVSSTVDESMRNPNDAKKRLRTDDSLDESSQNHPHQHQQGQQPCNKIIKIESDDEGNCSSKHFLDDSNDSMWRPW